VDHCSGRGAVIRLDSVVLHRVLRSEGVWSRVRLCELR
jgi:hypothetical protein